MQRLILLLFVLYSSVFGLTKQSTCTFTTYTGYSDIDYSLMSYQYSNTSYYGPFKAFESGYLWSSRNTVFVCDTNVGSGAVISSAVLRLSLQVNSNANNLPIICKWGSSGFEFDFGSTACPTYTHYLSQFTSGYKDISLTNLSSINKTGNTNIGIGLYGQPGSGYNDTSWPGGVITITYTLPGGPRLIIVTDSD